MVGGSKGDRKLQWGSPSTEPEWERRNGRSAKDPPQKPSTCDQRIGARAKESVPEPTLAREGHGAIPSEIPSEGEGEQSGERGGV